jgi:excisionase family DNA binding protein
MSQSQIPQSKWCSEAGAADYLDCSRSFLSKDRVTGLHGIPFYRLGRHIRYSIDDLDDFLLRSRTRAGAATEGE